MIQGVIGDTSETSQNLLCPGKSNRITYTMLVLTFGTIIKNDKKINRYYYEVDNWQGSQASTI